MKAIAFDLDGTLVDTARGIIGCFQSALFALGRQAPSAEELTSIIGPPLRGSFRQRVDSDEEAEEALRHYRAEYNGGRMFEAVVYSGIYPALGVLRREGRRLFVCTSKPHLFAERILAHFGLTRYFDGVYGPELHGTFEDKGELLAHMIVREALAPAQLVMVGDRDFDMDAARRNHVARVGVLWGYGNSAELNMAGANVLCRKPFELPGVLSDLDAMQAAAMRSSL